MNKKNIFVSAIFVLMTTCAIAQKKDTIVSNELKEVVISDSKFALSKEKSGKVIATISAKDLKNRIGESVATILNSVAGVEINGNQSGTGKNLEYYIRGGRSRQTLIMIDGVPVNDGSQIDLVYDLRLLTADQVERIEIMKGASSTLYGTGAANGVINITLKKSSKKPIVGNYYLNLGTQNTAETSKYMAQEVNHGLSFNGSLDKFNYLASVNHTNIGGISEAKGVDFEEDKFSKTNSLIKIGYKFNEKFSLDGFGSFDRIKNSFDDGTFADNIGNYSLTEQFRAGIGTNYKYNKGEFVLKTAGTLVNRNLFNYGSMIVYKYRNANVDAFNKYNFNENLFVVIGNQFQFFDSNSESDYGGIVNATAKMTTVDPYINGVYNSNFGLSINAGSRLNMHSKYGNHWVYNFNPSYKFKDSNLKIITSYSTAFITPSLYQLYDNYAGNLDLKPEESATIEAGFETKFLKNKIDLSVIGFYREEKNPIEYYTIDPMTWAGSYFNREGKYNAKGIEATIGFKPTENIKLNANYCFTEVEAKIINNDFPDISANLNNPKHKVNINADYQINTKLHFNLNYQFTDKKDSFDGYPAVIYNLNAYQLFNTNIQYELIKNRMTIFGAVTNILNTDFVENIGYNTRGRNFKVGLNIKF